MFIGGVGKLPASLLNLYQRHWQVAGVSSESSSEASAHCRWLFCIFIRGIRNLPMLVINVVQEPVLIANMRYRSNLRPESEGWSFLTTSARSGPDRWLCQNGAVRSVGHFVSLTSLRLFSIHLHPVHPWLNSLHPPSVKKFAKAREL